MGLHDFGDLGELLNHGREDFLPQVNGDERLERVPQKHGTDGALEREKGGVALEPCHPRLNRIASEPQPVGERDNGGAGIIGERNEKVVVELVVTCHNAQ